MSRFCNGRGPVKKYLLDTVETEWGPATPEYVRLDYVDHEYVEQISLNGHAQCLKCGKLKSAHKIKEEGTAMNLFKGMTIDEWVQSYVDRKIPINLREMAKGILKDFVKEELL